MEIIKLGEKRLQCPTIVKIDGHFYVVSKLSSPDSEYPKKYIAIDLNNGEWFDWGYDIECLNLDMETFPKGNKFEIEI